MQQVSTIFLHIYTVPPLIKTLIETGKSGLIRGVTSCAGYIKYNMPGLFSELWPYKRHAQTTIMVDVFIVKKL